MKNNERVVVAAVMRYGVALRYKSGGMKNDKRVAIAAPRQNLVAPQLAPEEPREQRASHDGGGKTESRCHGVTYASEEDIRNNARVVMMTAVTRNGRAPRYASEDIRNHHEPTVLAAVRSDGRAPECASAQGRMDVDAVGSAPKQNAAAKRFASRPFLVAAWIGHRGGAEWSGVERSKPERNGTERNAVPKERWKPSRAWFDGKQLSQKGERNPEQKLQEPRTE